MSSNCSTIKWYFVALAGAVEEGMDSEIAVVDLSCWCYIEPCKLYGWDCGLEVI